MGGIAWAWGCGCRVWHGWAGIALVWPLRGSTRTAIVGWHSHGHCRVARPCEVARTLTAIASGLRWAGVALSRLLLPNAPASSPFAERLYPSRRPPPSSHPSHASSHLPQASTCPVSTLPAHPPRLRIPPVHSPSPCPFVDAILPCPLIPPPSLLPPSSTHPSIYSTHSSLVFLVASHAAFCGNTEHGNKLHACSGNQPHTTSYMLTLPHG